MIFLYIVIGLVLIFDFINGFHDSANSIATVVSTRVLSPLSAVAFAAIFNFLAFLIFPLRVATTIGKGVIDPNAINLTLISSAVTAAIIWNLITWWLGLPSSSSHTLVGGLVGASVAANGFGSVILPGVVKIFLFIVLAPVLGMLISFFISVLTELHCAVVWLQLTYPAQWKTPLDLPIYFFAGFSPVRCKLEKRHKTCRSKPKAKLS